MRFDKGPGRALKLLAAAILADKVFAGLSISARFVLVFLAVLVADNVRLKSEAGNVIYLEDVVAGVLKYAGLGLLCWWLDFELSLYTGRHADPVLPAVFFAAIDRAWSSGRSLPRGR